MLFLNNVLLINRPLLRWRCILLFSGLSDDRTFLIVIRALLLLGI